jgi:hypothetical protein
MHGKRGRTVTSNRASSTRSDKHELVRAELRRRGGGRVCHRGTYNTSTMNFDSDKVPEKKTQGITPFARKSNLLASTLSGPTASPTWSWATSYAGSGGGGGGGGGDRQEPSSSSDSRGACNRRWCTCTRHVPILSSRKASWQASGLLTTSCRSRTSEIIG